MGNGHAGKCATSSSPVTPRATPATLGTGKGNTFNRNKTRNTNRGQCKTERDKSQSDEIKLEKIGLKVAIFTYKNQLKNVFLPF
jgi:hypothetical protein